MKRRNFLKLVAAAVVCPAVVCPKGLLKDKPECESTGVGNRRWRGYATYNGPLTGKEKEMLLKKFRKAFKNTKFKSKLKGPIYYRGVPLYHWGQLDV